MQQQQGPSSDGKTIGAVISIKFIRQYNKAVPVQSYLKQISLGQRAVSPQMARKMIVIVINNITHLISGEAGVSHTPPARQRGEETECRCQAGGLVIGSAAATE